MPGITQREDRSTTSAPAGTASAIALTRPSSTTITALSRTFCVAGSTRWPARMASVAAGTAPATVAQANASTKRLVVIRRMALLRDWVLRMLSAARGRHHAIAPLALGTIERGVDVAVQRLAVGVAVGVETA